LTSIPSKLGPLAGELAPPFSNINTQDELRAFDSGARG
jgi:hypothetical protein